MRDVAVWRDALADRYRVGRRLGSGGMAEVYLAHDLKHERDVAIKILRPELAASLGTERFLREILIEARLQHPNILGLIDSGTVEQAAGVVVPYYVMPYVEGETLRDRLNREKQLPLGDALQIAREVGDALSYAHSRGVVHRDIKPGNILLSSGHACVADFGIARAISAAGTEDLTGTGAVVGTPHYMSPEQASGDPSLDGRADIYALGCVLYEMLAGEPPFRGPSAQAILMRQRSAEPPSLKTRRPQLPAAVEAAVSTALAKVPADRFSTASQFMAALDGGAAPSRPPRTGPVGRRAAAVAAVAGTLAMVGGAAVWWQSRDPAAGLDPNRVVVFPLQDTPRAAGEGSGEAVATYIGYALDGAAPLRWLDGWDFLNQQQRADVATVPAATARSISRSQRAGFYIDGAIVQGPDSLTVVLRLHDVAGDSVVQRAGASAALAEASPPQLGLRAVGVLLPALLEPGRRVDLAGLSERIPAAVASFLQGEREYRRVRFASALEHYRKAVAEDSGFALAALKGAGAAYWLGQESEAEQLIDIAFERVTSLPPRHAHLTHALHAYAGGSADSALAHLREALRVDPEWTEALMATGEVYYHLLPNEPQRDSLAEAYFIASHATDSTFTPPSIHLAEVALRRGDVAQATRFIRSLRDGDSTEADVSVLESMLACVRDGEGSVDWDSIARTNSWRALRAAKALSGGGEQPSCATAGFAAVLRSGRASEEHRWAALLGLQSLLVATGRHDAVRELLNSESMADLAGSLLYLLDAAATGQFAVEAARVAAQRGGAYATKSSPELWLLGTWEAHLGRPGPLQQIAQALAAKADSTRSRRDSLLVRIIAAHSALARGDSATALNRLFTLAPTGSRSDLEWQPWEALGYERVKLAELLLSRSRFAESHRVAATLDSPQPIVFLLYLPASLTLRGRAALGMGRPDLSARYEARLAALRRTDVVSTF